MHTWVSRIIAPRLTGSDNSPSPGIQQPSSHMSHHAPIPLAGIKAGSDG
jgi:hypothetical protein